MIALMLAFSMTSPAEVLDGLAARTKRRRLELGLTQRACAARAGVSYAALRLLETTGKISLEGFVKIAFVLEAEAGLDALFPLPAPRTIEEVLERRVPQRAPRKGPAKVGAQARKDTP